jgi:hypothetical protein
VKFEDIKGPKYNVILNELKRHAKLHKSPAEVTRDVAKLRLQLAKIIAGPTFSHTPIATEPTTPASRVLVVKSMLKDEFVARPEYEQAIRQLRDKGEKHLWLWGDAGTGKTRLARAANRDVINENSVSVLQAGDRQQLEEQISALLVKFEVAPEAINPTNLWPLFINALKHRLSSVVVFDDMPDDSLVDLLTVDTETLLIFTSVRQPPIKYKGHRIEVGEMNEVEAREMIRSRLPGIGEPDVNELIGALGGRPLALEHSCHYLRETGMSIATYCQAVRRAPDKVLDAAGDRYGRTLTRVYELALGALDDSFDSLRALDYP